MIKAFVGAGGKTSEIFKEAEYFRNIGKRVFVCTSTHMLIDDNTLTVNINRIRNARKGMENGVNIAEITFAVLIKVLSAIICSSTT